MSKSLRQRLLAASVILAIAIAWGFGNSLRNGIRWSVNIGSEVTSVSTDSNLLYVATEYEGIIVIDTKTGNEVRRMHPMNVHSMLPPHKDRNILLASETSVYALRGDNGEVKWERHANSWPRLCAAMDEKTLYYSDNNVTAVSAGSGELIWTVPTGNQELTNIVVDRDTVFVTTQDTTIAIDAQNHKIRWSQPIGAAYYSLLAVGNGELAVFDSQFRLLILDSHTGVIKWHYPDSPLYRGYLCMDVSRNTLYLTEATGGVYSIDLRTNHCTWKAESGIKTEVPCQPFGRGVAVVGGIGQFAVLDSTSGKVKEKYNLSSIVDRMSITNHLIGNCVNATATDASGAIYVGTAYGRVYKID